MAETNPVFDKDLANVLMEANMAITDISHPMDIVHLDLPAECASDEDSANRYIKLNPGHYQDGEPLQMSDISSCDQDLSPSDISEFSDNKYQQNTSVLSTRTFLPHNLKAEVAALLSPEVNVSSTTSSVSLPLLPPCRVCGGKASGFHYGANTCEACKGFFRRCITNVERHKRKYECPKNGDCDLSTGRRMICSSCRYHKCIAIGMSRSAIKTGRYTYEKKTRDIRELKKLQYSDRPEVQSIMSTDKTEVGKLHLSCKPDVFTFHTDVTDDEIKSIISTLVNVQRKIDPNFYKVFDKDFTLQKHKRIHKEYEDKMTTLECLPIDSKESDVFKELYHETGIILDETVLSMEQIARNQDKLLKNMVEFLKPLHGLKDIPIDDQAKLIKGSHTEYWFLIKHKMIDTELKVISDSFDLDSIGLHQEEAIGLFRDKEFIDEAFVLARSLQSLDLTEEEVAIARGIVLTFTDRCNLEQPEKVEKVQWKLIDCLRWLSNKNKWNPEYRFYKILDRLTALRNLTELFKNIKQEKSKWSIMKKYPLVLEMTNTNGM